MEKRAETAYYTGMKPGKKTSQSEIDESIRAEAYFYAERIKQKALDIPQDGTKLASDFRSEYFFIDWEFWQQWRVPLIIMGCLQNFLASGIFYGWASLYIILLDNGVYSELCDGAICQKQKDALQQIYIVAASCNLLTQLPWGMILDRTGPRICSTLATSFVMVGFFLLAMSTSNFRVYNIAICIIAAAGPGVQISLFHLSALYPANQSLAVALISGAFNLGFIVFLLFKFAASEFGLSLSTLSLFYCLPLICMVAFSGIVWPDRPFFATTEVSEQRVSQPSYFQETLETSGAPMSPLPAIPELTTMFDQEKQPLRPQRYGKLADGEESYMPLRFQDLKAQAFTMKFGMMLLWFTVCLFWANFYIGTVVEQLWAKTGDPELTREYTSYFNAILSIGAVGVPLCGLVTDAYGFAMGVILTTMMATSFALLTLFPSLWAQIAAFISYSFFRSFLFTILFSYLGKVFGYKNFGVLSGLVLCISGCVGLLQYVFVAFNMSYGTIDYLQFISLVCANSYAAYLISEGDIKV